MRTTLDLDDGLLRAARMRAAARGSTLTAVIEEALAALLASRPAEKKPFKLKWKVSSGEYVGGIDIADRNALYDALDEEQAARWTAKAADTGRSKRGKR